MTRDREAGMEHEAARYVDGVMEGEERARFEARLAESRTLRAEVEVLRRVDDSLRRSFAGTGPVVLRGAADGADGGSGRAARRPVIFRLWPMAGALAAAAVIVAAGITWGPAIGVRRAPTVAAPSMTVEGVYALEASRGWKIEHVCESEAEFASYTLETIGEALVASSSEPAGVEITGWLGYDVDMRALGLDRRAKLVLARADGSPVLVFLDPGGERNVIRSAGGGELRLFRREVGGVSLYEVTPLEEARVVGLFEAAPPGAPGGGG